MTAYVRLNRYRNWASSVSEANHWYIMRSTLQYNRPGRCPEMSWNWS